MEFLSAVIVSSPEDPVSSNSPPTLTFTPFLAPSSTVTPDPWVLLWWLIFASLTET